MRAPRCTMTCCCVGTVTRVGAYTAIQISSTRLQIECTPDTLLWATPPSVREPRSVDPSNNLPRDLLGRRMTPHLAQSV